MQAVTVMWMCLLIGSVLHIHDIQAAVFGSKMKRDPEHPDQCYDEQLKAYFEVGDVWAHPGQCAKIKCLELEDDPDSLWIRGETCFYAASFPANCKLTKPSLFAVFPYCCPVLDCDGDPEGPISQVG